MSFYQHEQCVLLPWVLVLLKFEMKVCSGLMQSFKPVEKNHAIIGITIFRGMNQISLLYMKIFLHGLILQHTSVQSFIYDQ